MTPEQLRVENENLKAENAVLWEEVYRLKAERFQLNASVVWPGLPLTYTISGETNKLTASA